MTYNEENLHPIFIDYFRHFFLLKNFTNCIQYYCNFFYNNNKTTTAFKIIYFLFKKNKTQKYAALFNEHLFNYFRYFYFR